MPRLLSKPTPKDGSSRSTFVSVVVLAAIYLAFAMTYTLLTPAWEPNDEIDHTKYIEYVARHGEIPTISIHNGHESHQPPLYYLIAATWQRMLGIPTFTPNVQTATRATGEVRGKFFTGNSHHYTPTQHREALYLHELRLLSVLLGLGTVLLTYAGARITGSNQPTAVSCALFVALLPKELVVSTAVTNDVLVIALCALALVLFLLAERSRLAERLSRHRLFVLGMGLALGAAAITKFNSLPLAVLLIGLVGAWALRRGLKFHRRLAPDLLIALGGFLTVSGWWFLHNKHLYGQYLATSASERYLAGLFFIHPEPWSLFLFTHQIPRELSTGLWYEGFANQLYLPHWMNLVLTWLAALSVLVGVWALVRKSRFDSWVVSTFSALGLIGSIISGLVALAIVTQATIDTAARVFYVGLAGFAIVSIAGTRRLASLVGPRMILVGLYLWPALLLLLDLYVFVEFLIPFRGL